MILFQILHFRFWLGFSNDHALLIGGGGHCGALFYPPLDTPQHVYASDWLTFHLDLTLMMAKKVQKSELLR